MAMCRDIARCRRVAMNAGGNEPTVATQDQLARETLAVVLAGGKGTRLGALTRHECKPALRFGGFYRNIDFSLSNCVNSGVHRIGVATQYQDESLVQHIASIWRDPGGDGKGFVEPWRADVRANSAGYCGTADAVYQNRAKIESLDPRLVLILAGDHVYKMDYRPMLMRHMALNADVTVGCVEVPIDKASQFGVMSIDCTHRVVRFSEKPQLPESLPGRPGRALGSMGIYVYNREFLDRMLREDAVTETSSHDFGRDLMPRAINRARVFAYPFTDEATVGGGYWRDVGTLSAYWRTHMELVDGMPNFHLDDPTWPIRRDEQILVDWRFGTSGYKQPNNVTCSLLAGGCKTRRAKVHRSVLFANATVGEHADVANAVVLPNAVIGRHCFLRDVIVASGVTVPDGTVITPTNHSADTPILVTAETNITRKIENRNRQRYNQPVRRDGERPQRTGT